MPSRESFDIGDELTGVSPAQIPTEALDLFGATIGILREHRLRAFLPQVLDLVLLLGFWFAGGFAWLDAWTRSFGFGPIATGLVITGVSDTTCFAASGRSRR